MVLLLLIFVILKKFCKNIILNYMDIVYLLIPNGVFSLLYLYRFHRLIGSNKSFADLFWGSILLVGFSLTVFLLKNKILVKRSIIAFAGEVVVLITGTICFYALFPHIKD